MKRLMIEALRMKVSIAYESYDVTYFEVEDIDGKKYTVSIRDNGKFSCECRRFSFKPFFLCPHIVACIVYMTRRIEKA